MFHDFDRRRRWRPFGAFILALVVSLTFVGSAIAWAIYRTPVAPPEPEPEPEDVAVEFAPPPEPEPEPEPVAPPPEPAAVFRPAAVRPAIVTPDEIPDEAPEESDEDLAEARDTGPVGGDTRGVPGGTGQATAPAEPEPPPPPPETRERREVRVTMEEVRRPRQVAGPRAPEVPRAARASGVQGVVLVRVVIDETGALRRYEIVRGPELFYDAVRAWLRLIRFEPARRADGSATSWTGMIPARFNARNL